MKEAIQVTHGIKEDITRRNMGAHPMNIDGATTNFWNMFPVGAA